VSRVIPHALRHEVSLRSLRRCGIVSGKGDFSSRGPVSAPQRFAPQRARDDAPYRKNSSV
jgi:hypothetical protein